MAPLFSPWHLLRERKDKETRGICGCTHMQSGRPLQRRTWTSLLSVAPVFTFTRLVTVIMDFPVNVMEKKQQFSCLSSPSWDFSYGEMVKYVFQHLRLCTHAVVGELEMNWKQ